MAVFARSSGRTALASRESLSSCSSSVAWNLPWRMPELVLGRERVRRTASVVDGDGLGGRVFVLESIVVQHAVLLSERAR